MPEPTQGEIIQELFKRRSELAPDEGAVVDELMKRMTASGEIRGAEPGARPQLPGRLGTQEPTPTEQSPAWSRFFSALGNVMMSPVHGAQEYIERPANIAKAVEGGFGTKPGAVEEAMNVPLSNPMAYQPGPVMGPALTAAGQVQQGDVAGALGTATGAYGALPAVGYGIGKTGQAIVRGPGRALTTTEGRAALGRAQGLGETLQVMARGPDVPSKLMTQALRPINKNVKFEQNINTALPEIAQSAEQMGVPITNIDEMLDAVKHAKKRVWAQREAITGNQGPRQIDLSPVGDAVERTITKRMLLHEPEKVAAIREFADRYRGRTFAIEEAEDLLRGANDELSSYYAKNPLAQRVALGNNPDTASLHAEAGALRDRIYGELDRAGQGTAPRELSRRYGALLDVEKEIYRRANVAKRQSDFSLSEQVGTIHAARDTLLGLGKIATGQWLSGARDIGGAWAMRKAASALAEAGKTDALIERTFRNYTKRPIPVAVQRPE